MNIKKKGVQPHEPVLTKICMVDDSEKTNQGEISKLQENDSTLIKKLRTVGIVCTANLFFSIINIEYCL